MTPKQRNLLIAERAAAYARINEIAALLDADDKARYDADPAKADKAAAKAAEKGAAVLKGLFAGQLQTGLKVINSRNKA